MNHPEFEHARKGIPCPSKTVGPVSLSFQWARIKPTCRICRLGSPQFLLFILKPVAALTVWIAHARLVSNLRRRKMCTKCSVKKFEFYSSVLLGLQKQRFKLSWTDCTRVLDSWKEICLHLSGHHCCRGLTNELANGRRLLSLSYHFYLCLTCDTASSVRVLLPADVSGIARQGGETTGRSCQCSLEKTSSWWISITAVWKKRLLGGSQSGCNS